MSNHQIDIQADIAAINSIAVVPLILEIICRTTGMGFAVVARVTEEQWIACSVRDEVQFGLAMGGELKLTTTLCHEVRQNNKLVVIDHVGEDHVYVNHHTPAMYGLQSYISVPIMRASEGFFGTLCAIDPKPSLLNTPEILNMFKAYAHLIAFYLNTAERASQEEMKIWDERFNNELKQHLDNVMAYSEGKINGQTLYAANRKDAHFNQIIQHASDGVNKLLEQLKAIQ